ncbi:hypothetical protein CPB83DRAFT_837849 [Crepidotus variabilis]|uniref:SUN domain-containing protein n=1 Tax=Crepidotus variabilis TaxID=179855 RepID=A0A9P6EB08_9AGAR|nr:hypothetical protein CPB83DRAFT_837849 [Crepidotus variabilis]
MSFSGTPLGQGRRLDHNAFLGKPPSANNIAPSSYSYGAPALGPRSPPKPTSPSRDDEDNENDSALSRFARLKQREATRDFSNRPGGPKIITSPPKTEKWSVKDTSVNIATAFHQAVIDTVGGGEADMSGTHNPNNAWASGSRLSQVPRSTSVEYEAAAPHTANRRLPAPPDKTTRNPQRKPPSKSTSLRHVPDSEGEEDQSSISRARGKSPFEHGLTYAKQALGAAVFYARQRSTEPENRSGEQPQPSVNGNGNESSYEYTAEEQAFQAARRANSSVASANGSAAQRRNRISVDNKAYKPSRESEDEESEWSDNGKTKRRKKKLRKGPAGGPLSTLPVVSAGKRRKRKGAHGGSKGNVLDDDESDSEENTQVDQQSQSGVGTSMPPPSRAAPSRHSQEPSYLQDDSNISADQGLQSIPEIDENLLPPDTPAKPSEKPASTTRQAPQRRRAGSRGASAPPESAPPTRFSIGNLIGRFVYFSGRLIMWMFSGIVSCLSMISFLFGQVFGTTFDLIFRKPVGWTRSSGAASGVKYIIPALVLVLAWWALKDTSLSFPGRSGGVYTPPSIPPSDLTELSSRLLKLEHMISGLTLESERSRTKSEDSLKSVQDLKGQLGSLEGKFVTETRKADDVERKTKDALSQGLSSVKREIEVLQEEVKHQRKVLDQHKEQAQHQQPKGDSTANDEEARVRLKALEERIGSVEGGVKDALEQLSKKPSPSAAVPVPSVGSAWWNKLASNVGSLKASNGQDVSTIISQMVDTAVFSAMTSDLIGKPDFALHSTGAHVIPGLTSRTLEIQPSGWASWMMGLVTNTGFSEGRPPVTALHHEGHHGHCWPFEGSEGQLGVMLARPAILDSFSIDHVPKDMTFEIRSAPRRMEVWGLVEGETNLQTVRAWKEELQNLREEASDERKAAIDAHVEGAAWTGYPKTLPKFPEYLRLSSFEYDVDKDRSVQTFDIDGEVKKLGIDFGIVVLRVMSNWGIEDFTCLYRFRVHGEALHPGPRIVTGDEDVQDSPGGL